MVRIFKLVLIFTLTTLSQMVLCAPQEACGQETKDAQPPQAATDADYRKFDELLSMIRTRNADIFSIKSAKGIDEASFVEIGGIKQWVTVRGQDRANPVLLFFCMAALVT